MRRRPVVNEPGRSERFSSPRRVARIPDGRGRSLAALVYFGRVSVLGYSSLNSLSCENYVSAAISDEVLYPSAAL